MVLRSPREAGWVPWRAAGRGASWLLALGWTVAAVWRADWSEKRDIGFGVLADCRPGALVIVVELGVAALGIGLICWSLNVPAAGLVKRITMIGAVAALWLLVALFRLPLAAQDCVN